MKGRTHRLQSADHHEDWVDGSWTVDCVCGVNYDDGEEMVNCDECGVWVHTRCSGYTKGDKLFTCDKCKGKGNRNDSEETEVAQLLVELPTKTVRIESSYVGPRIEKPMEERVHVQGVPGGDPGLFGGLSGIFTPELWKCTGYVPKKFNFQYREFPCWDEKKGADVENDNENGNGNLVDNGAGVLFSLSKERVFGAPVYRKKEISKEVKKQEDNDVDERSLQNGVRKDRCLFQPIFHSSKRKKQELGVSKDWSGKKKARTPGDKETDERKRAAHPYKTVVFRHTSDAKKLEFYEDRGPKSSKTDVQSAKTKHFKDNPLEEQISDGNLPLHGNNLVAVVRCSKASPSDMSGHNFAISAEMKEDKAGHQLPAVIKSSPKTENFVALPIGNGDSGSIAAKEEDHSLKNVRLDGSKEVYSRSAQEHQIEDIGGAAAEVKGSQIPQDFKGSKSQSSDQASIKVKIEMNDDNSKGITNVQSSPPSDAKDPGITFHHMLETSKVNDAVRGSSQSCDRKAQIVNGASETVGECHNGNELSNDPLECLEGSDSLQRSSSESKCRPGIAEDSIKLEKNVMNPQAPSSQHKMVVCVGKSSTTSGTALTTVSSTPENAKPHDSQDSNPNIKVRVVSDSSANVRKDSAGSNVVTNEDRNDLSRKTVKERSKSSAISAPKSSASSASKVLHQSRMLHASVSKRMASESKDSVLHSSSKASSLQNTLVPPGPGESAGSLQSQSASHIQHNKSNFQASSKTNNASAVHPPAPSNSLAALSDEELALLLHQELNSSPRVPRVPRVRHAGSFPQLASASATSILIKRTSSSGGRDQSSVSRRKNKDASKDGFHGSRELDDENKKTARVPSSPDRRRQDIGCAVDASSRREDKNVPPTITATTNSGPSSSTEANDQNLSSIRNSPRNISDDDAGTVRDPVPRTLPGLINEIMSKGRRMTYEELCDAVLPHWPNLRKHNGERYAYSSHSQAVLDCLRNRHEWAHLVDRGPKTNSGRKKRKIDAEESEDNQYGKGRTTKEVDVESKSLDSQREEFPKGKRNARKRRRLALQGRGIKDVQRRRKADFTDDDNGPFSDSSEESMFSEDEIQGGGASPDGSEDTASSDETETE
ncbi:hypothetical protein SLEP1_g16255 [Rubroshorea leprosula]|uniref:Zinc finger PHD-type domain-containing protein n=1 Tax=Rubroshorea leprosula TaxID=152421 RepID=A0AAV5IXX1_9ROSI|nr:hypothetical protein SLEP1_g16255 [Rubroshorea leprosula]